MAARVKELTDLYNIDVLNWESMSNLTERLGWEDLLAKTAAEYYDAAGVSEKFSRELIESSTRVNYGQVSTFLFRHFERRN